MINYLIVFGCHLAIILGLLVYYYIFGKNSNKARFYTRPFLITSGLLLIPLVVQAFIYKSMWFDFSDEIQKNNIDIENYKASITSLESEIVNNPEKKEDQEKLISLSEKKKKTNIDMNNNYELQKLFRIVTIVAIVLYILLAIVSWSLTPAGGPPIQLDPVLVGPSQSDQDTLKEQFRELMNDWIELNDNPNARQKQMKLLKIECELLPIFRKLSDENLTYFGNHTDYFQQYNALSTFNMSEMTKPANSKQCEIHRDKIKRLETLS